MAYLFQPKHILLISKIIRNFILPEKTKLKLVKSFDQYFFEDNPMYNRKKFFDISMSVLDDKEVYRHYRHMSCGDLNDLILNKPQNLYLWDYHHESFWTVNKIPAKLIEKNLVTLRLSITLPYDVNLDECGFTLRIPKELEDV
jgi:hypothetical protein